MTAVVWNTTVPARTATCVLAEVATNTSGLTAPAGTEDSFTTARAAAFHAIQAYWNRLSAVHADVGRRPQLRPLPPSDPQLTDHLRSVLAEANGQPQGVAIAVGYFYLPGFTQVRDLLPTRPGKDRIRRVPQGRLDRPC